MNCWCLVEKPLKNKSAGHELHKCSEWIQLRENFFCLQQIISSTACWCNSWPFNYLYDKFSIQGRGLWYHRSLYVSLWFTGYGFLEIVYKEAIEIEFSEKEIEHAREKEFPIIYKGKKLKRTFFSDFCVFNKIIVEVKTNSDGITEDAIPQTLNYLKASGHRVGLIINFGKRKLEYKRPIL